MKTLVKSLVAITCLKMVVGCEDDRIYPSPQKYTPQPPVVTSEIHIAAEFTAKFDKTLTETNFTSGVRIRQPLPLSRSFRTIRQICTRCFLFPAGGNLTIALEP